MPWTREQLVFVTTAYFTYGKSIVKAQRSFEMKYRLRMSPSKKVIKRCVKNFSESGNLNKKKPSGRPVSATNENKVANAQQIVEENQQISLKRLSQQLDISLKSAHTILRKKLFMYPYKVQICQKLHEGDFARRVTFCEWLLRKHAENANFIQNLIVSDEAHFALNGCVNKQNVRFWGTENPKELREVPLHSERVTVWCGMTENEIIGPYFFEDDNGKTVTVNGQRYHNLVTDFLIPKVNEMNVANLYFQQDGATCHTTRPNMEILRQKFPGRVISRYGDVEWPARSPDLSPLDFFLWGYLKGRIYRDNPIDITQLKAAIETEIRSIGQEMLIRAMDNLRHRAEICVRSGGQHLKDIIFKK